MSTNSELGLLQTYNRKLEDQNEAKTSQIRILRQQLSKGTTSRVISTTSVVSSCSNCKNKESEIENLNKRIREIQQSHRQQIQKIGTSSRVQKQIVYKEVPSSNDKEFANLKRQYEELKLKFQQAQKTQWSRIRVDNVTSQKQQVFIGEAKALRQENTELHNRIASLEKRLEVVDDANRILREELASNIKAGSIYTQPYQSHNLIYPKVTSYHQNQCGCPNYSPLSALHPRTNVHHNHSSYLDSSYFKDIAHERWNSLQHKIRVLEVENSKLRSQVCLPTY